MINPLLISYINYLLILVSATVATMAATPYSLFEKRNDLRGSPAK
jgi:hypothetical protein